jgi:hypothetical protein
MSPDIQHQRFEDCESESAKWERAYIGKDIYRGHRYLTLLTLSTDPSKAVRASLNLKEDRVFIDIPTRDSFPDTVLFDQAYNTTLFGEIDREQFRNYGLDPYRVDHLLSYLNRKAAGVENEDSPNWFYSTFALEHAQSYGNICISSHGGQSNFNITIERKLNSVERALNVAIETSFWDRARTSLPHINFTPWSVDAYLEEVVSTLKFLPKDW